MKNFLLGMGATLLWISPLWASTPTTPLFSAEALEASVQDLYTLSPEDQEACLEALAQMIAVLPPESFNDFTAHALADYAHHAAHRKVLGRLLNSMRWEIREELSSPPDPLSTLMDDIFLVWIGAYTFGFGKGLWKTKGLGLSHLREFRSATRRILAELPQGHRTHLTLTAVGTTAGLTHALWNFLQTRRLDPVARLTRIQSMRNQEIHKKLESIHSALSTLKIQDWDSSYGQLLEAQKELSELLEQAPHLKNEIQQNQLLLRILIEQMLIKREQFSVSA